MKNNVYGVSCYFFNCEGLEAEPEFHRSAVKQLQELGSVFFKCAPFPAPVESNPKSEITEEGRLKGFILASHPLLRPTVREWEVDQHFMSRYGSADESRSFRMSTVFIRTDERHFTEAIQDMAHGRREFLKLVIPHVKPCVAVADNAWDLGVKHQDMAVANLRRLFWATYFGPNYVEKHGLEFLLKTPAWKVEELSGGVLITVTEKYLNFTETEPKETLKYLKQKFKNIRPNRYKIDSNF